MSLNQVQSLSSSFQKTKQFRTIEYTTLPYNISENINRNMSTAISPNELLYNATDSVNDTLITDSTEGISIQYIVIGF